MHSELCRLPLRSHLQQASMQYVSLGLFAAVRELIIYGRECVSDLPVLLYTFRAMTAQLSWAIKKY